MWPGRRWCRFVEWGARLKRGCFLVRLCWAESPQTLVLCELTRADWVWFTASLVLGSVCRSKDERIDSYSPSPHPAPDFIQNPTNYLCYTWPWCNLQSYNGHTVLMGGKLQAEQTLTQVSSSEQCQELWYNKCLLVLSTAQTQILFSTFALVYQRCVLCFTAKHANNLFIPADCSALEMGSNVCVVALKCHLLNMSSYPTPFVVRPRTQRWTGAQNGRRRRRYIWFNIRKEDFTWSSGRATRASRVQTYR